VVGNIEGFGTAREGSAIECRDGSRGFFGGGKADKTKSFRVGSVCHDLVGNNISKNGEFFLESFFINVILDILNVEVNALVFVQFQLFPFFTELDATFLFLLGTATEDGFITKFCCI